MRGDRGRGYEAPAPALFALDHCASSAQHQKCLWVVCMLLRDSKQRIDRRMWFLFLRFEKHC